MEIGKLETLWRFFGGDTSAEDPETRTQLLKEVMVMVLSRAAASDSNIRGVEVETVQRVFMDAFESEISAADIRTAAKSELYETTPLESYLRRASTRQNSSEKQLIVRALGNVIEADQKVGPFEVEYFNMVATALQLTPAEIAGLSS